MRIRIGSIRELDRNVEFTNSSPNTDFNINLGSENTVGLDNTFPNNLVKSAFVTGLGDTAFIGPLIDSSTIAYTTRVSKSSSPIQLIYWLPFPIFPPRPILKEGRIFARIPPEADNTVPIRKLTTRIPDSLAIWLASSQFLQTSDKKSMEGKIEEEEGEVEKIQMETDFLLLISHYLCPHKFQLQMQKQVL